MYGHSLSPKFHNIGVFGVDGKKICTRLHSSHPYLAAADDWADYGIQCKRGLGNL